MHKNPETMPLKVYQDHKGKHVCRPTILAVTFNINLMRIISRGRSDKVKSNLYGSIVWPYQEYASNVWDLNDLSII